MINVDGKHYYCDITPAQLRTASRSYSETTSFGLDGKDKQGKSPGGSG